jgi:glyoxylase-like metal-dependent hydrolase (beta-lactamase superfamily II)
MTNKTMTESSGMLCHAVIPVTRAKQNCSLIWCSETRQGALIDPGGDVDRIMDAVKEHGVALEQILVTHGHCDHAGSVADLSEELGLAIIGPHREELFLLHRIADQGDMYDMDWARTFLPDRWLKDGDLITIGHQTIQAIHCPGHTPGHIVYFSESARMAFVGDVLFHGLIGSSQGARGDHFELLRSILGKLWPLGDDVTFVPGHGPLSTIGEERRSNPFVCDEKMAPYIEKLFAMAQ